MRTALSIALLGLIGVLLVASPAVAQRDPFEPQIGTASPPPTDSPTTEPGVEPEPEVPPQPDDLSNTGMDTQPWLVIAYVLVATGVAAVTVAGVSRFQN